MDLGDKVALITGGGRGIGRGIATVLARNGADVVVADINQSDVDEGAEAISSLGRRALGYRVDVTDQESVGAMVAATLSEFGRIDILVNNAGIVAAAGWENRDESTWEDWDQIFEVNVKGIVRVTNAVSVHMKERHYGKIVNIASVAGRGATGTSAPYSVSKSGVIILTQAQALELAPFDITANSICPSLLWTPMWERISTRWTRDPKYEGLTPRQIFDQVVKDRIPLGREQTPEDIGNAVTFLASDASKNITGQALNVSGGSHIN
jgi:NAD(P)-dependent dehydrogenase (short-subunit alcohol dehydrogenase family)